MKMFKFTILLAAVAAMAAGTANASLMFTGIIDGPLSGGVPKMIELYAIDNIPDLSVYGIEVAGNGTAPTGANEIPLDAVALSAGEFYYVASNESGPADYFGFGPAASTSNFQTGSVFINGDDALLLYDINNANATIDVLGVPGQDGTGTSWEHLDSWLYRVDGTGPSPTFDIAEWTTPGINALDGLSTNAEAAGQGVAFPIGTYTAIPEPSSAFIALGACFAGMVGMRRYLG